ncbi:Hpt domain-containing protein [Sphingosinicella sp.]|uniref:Hpt domain-containing protein n=1 Tax=Sphingosinicella sp. TaxID=1917971 RepID=UPI0040381B01
MDEAADGVVDWGEFSRLRAELGANFVRILGYFREDAEKAVEAIALAMQNRDAAALVLPAHKVKAEARQFGAEALANLAEEIEDGGRHALETKLFPDHLLPQVAQLRPLYRQTIDALEEATNPLAQRHPGASRAASNQGFGRL